MPARGNVGGCLPSCAGGHARPYTHPRRLSSRPRLPPSLPADPIGVDSAPRGPHGRCALSSGNPRVPYAAVLTRLARDVARLIGESDGRRTGQSGRTAFCRCQGGVLDAFRPPQWKDHGLRRSGHTAPQGGADFARPIDGRKQSHPPDRMLPVDVPQISKSLADHERTRHALRVVTEALS